MIIYGRKSSKIAAGQVEATCPCCQQKVQQTFQATNDYVHIYWIPFFPISRTYAVYCPFCRNVFKDAKIPADLRERLKENTSHVQRPLWHWTGLMLAGALLLLTLIK